MTERTRLVVYAALAHQLAIPVAEVQARAEDGLDRMGLDSHGLMRVLLEIERELGLVTALDLPDEALESPSTLERGVAAVVGAVVE